MVEVAGLNPAVTGQFADALFRGLLFLLLFLFALESHLLEDLGTGTKIQTLSVQFCTAALSADVNFLPADSEFVHPLLQRSAENADVDTVASSTDLHAQPVAVDHFAERQRDTELSPQVVESKQLCDASACFYVLLHLRALPVAEELFVLVERSLDVAGPYFFAAFFRECGGRRQENEERE